MRPLHDPSSLTQLAEQVHYIEQRRGGETWGDAGGRIVTGWPELDRTLGGGLPRGMVHEWFGRDGSPLCIVAHLASRALMHHPREGEAPAEPQPSRHRHAPDCKLTPTARREPRLPGQAPDMQWHSSVGSAVWIGRAIWPYPHVLARAAAGLLDRSIWLDPVSEDDRLWAIDQAVRCPAVSVVIADGISLTMAATRRLQLAAKTGAVLVLLLRPERELSELSAAGLRWLVAPAPSPTRHPRWTVELLRAKGAAFAGDGSPRRWLLERNHAEGLVHLPAELGDGTGAEEAGEGGARRRSA